LPLGGDDDGRDQTSLSSRPREPHFRTALALSIAQDEAARGHGIRMGATGEHHDIVAGEGKTRRNQAADRPCSEDRNAHFASSLVIALLRGWAVIRRTRMSRSRAAPAAQPSCQCGRRDATRNARALGGGPGSYRAAQPLLRCGRFQQTAANGDLPGGIDRGVALWSELMPMSPAAQPTLRACAPAGR
jgi:hypothetical protein